MRTIVHQALVFVGCILANLIVSNVDLCAQSFDIDQLNQIKEDLDIDVLGYAIVGPESSIFSGSLIQEPIMSPFFRVGSIAKVIVAIGIMRLVDQNQIDLDGKLSDYLPDLDFENKANAADPILVRHLLSHTSGLNEMGFSAYYVADGKAIGSVSEIVDQLENQLIQRRKPGECYIYSNLNYLLLARIIEVTTGKAANLWLENEVLLPLGMRESHFDVGEMRDEDRQIRGFQDGRPVRFHLGKLFPALGLIASMDDLGKLLKFLASNGKVVDKQFLSEASLTQMVGGSFEQYGPEKPIRPGFGLSLQDAFHSEIWTAEGGVEGFSTWMKVHPKSGKGIAVSVNHSPISAEEKLDIEAALGWEPDLGFVQPNHCGERAKTDYKPGYYKRINARNSIFKIYDDLNSWVFVHPSRSDSNLYILQTIEGHTLKVQICGMSGDSLDPRLPLAYMYKSSNGNTVFEIDNWQFEREDDYWLPFKHEVARFIYYYSLIMLFYGLGRALNETFVRKLRWNAWLLCTILNIIPFWAAYQGFEMLISRNFYELGHFGTYSFTLLALSLAIPIFTCLGFWWLVKQRSQKDIWLKVLNAFQFIFNLILTIYLASYGFLPFASWLN